MKVVVKKETYTHTSSSGLIYGFWAIARPMTATWGSGQVWKRICDIFGKPDVAFGKTDGIPDGVQAVDRKNGYEWSKMPFADNQFNFGYWDPPYDKLYKKEAIEIWRTCKKLIILHPHTYPTSWLVGAKRTGMVAVTMGPLKVIRSLQLFEKQP